MQLSGEFVSTKNGASRATNGRLHEYLITIEEQTDRRYTGIIEPQGGRSARFELHLHLPIEDQTRECNDAYRRQGVPGLEHVLDERSTVLIDGLPVGSRRNSALKEPVLLAYGMLLHRKRRFNERSCQFNIYC